MSQRLNLKSWRKTKFLKFKGLLEKLPWLLERRLKRVCLTNCISFLAAGSVKYDLIVEYLFVLVHLFSLFTSVMYIFGSICY